MRVLRIATTGEDSQRLVGMLIPEPAVEEVVAELSGERPQAGGDGPSASGGGGSGGGEGGGAGKSKGRGKGRSRGRGSRQKGRAQESE